MDQPSPYLRWLWWRHTWTFQLAHKPLCTRFHQDVLRIGPAHLCRSCTALYGCLAVGLLAGPWLVGHMDVYFAALVTFLLFMAIVASAPPLYAHVSRACRDLLRGSAGMLGGLSMMMLFTPLWLWGLANLLGLAAAWLIYRRLRNLRAERVDSCSGCSECNRGTVCSGFEKQARHLRAYEEAATAYLERRYEPAQRNPGSPTK